LLAGKQHQKQCTAGDSDHVPAVLLFDDVAAVVQLSRTVIMRVAASTQPPGCACKGCYLVVPVEASWCSCVDQSLDNLRPGGHVLRSWLNGVAQQQQAGSLLSCLSSAGAIKAHV
jgi:hypothetical protein